MKLFFSILFFLSIGILFNVSASEISPIQINEFMANPAGEDNYYEWIEIKNNSENIVSLTGWKLNNSIIPEYQLQPNEIVVMARNREKLAAMFPGLTIIQISMSLNNSSGELTLFNAEFLDKLSYSQTKEGISYERVSTDCEDLVFHNDSNSIGVENSHNFDFCNEVTRTIVNTSNNDTNLSGFENETIRLALNTSEEAGWFINDEFTSTGSTLNLNKSFGNYLIKALTDEITTAEVKIFPKINFSEVLANPDGTDSGSEWVELYHPNFIGELSEWKVLDISNSETFNLSFDKYTILNLSQISINNDFEVLKLVTPTGLTSDEITIEKNKEAYSKSLINGKWEDSIQTPGAENQIFIEQPKVAKPKKTTKKVTTKKKQVETTIEIVHVNYSKPEIYKSVEQKDSGTEEKLVMNLGVILIGSVRLLIGKFLSGF